MGIIGKLFEKKYCDVCGNEIAILGVKKLRDGNCCNNCVSQLSPYFTERKESTVSEIAYQITCRNQNAQKVRDFSMSRKLGNSVKVLIDEAKGQFMISDPKLTKNAIPDVIDCSSIIDCRIDITEKREEIKYEDSNGNVKSFNPPSFAYSYDFFIIIELNVPYINQIRFKLNDSVIDNGQQTRIKVSGGLLSNIADAFLPARSNNGKTSNADEVRASIPYIQCSQTANEIREILLSYRYISHHNSNTRDEKVTCPWCDSRVLPNEHNECPRCGGDLFTR